MNALELADKLNQSNSNGVMCDQAAVMMDPYRNATQISWAV